MESVAASIRAITPLGSARGAGARRHVRQRRARRSSLGAGLTQVPPAVETDPTAAVLAAPVVPEERRVCPSCGAPVGRGHDGTPGRTQGYCPQCRNPFSFTPKLEAGDLVAGQYEVAGPIAHGGLGWIYLARDRNVSGRWVVLKGLLNAGDEDAVAAAIAEQQFLAQVEHPQIVEVYNVVEHEGLAYTVMEYVGGASLKQMLKDRLLARGEYDPLPVETALAFVLEILPAFTYLHDHGLLYCDFKPDNLIHVADGVKLIDLGGMREIDDLDSPIYGTVGYQAPEVAEVGPSIASDIYTIGRTLVVLTTEFRGYQTRFVDSLPPLTQTPAFREHDSFYRLVARCCAPDPADRFVSVEELRVQMLGVLRQVVADTPGAGVTTQAPPSAYFEAPVVTGETLDWWQLPGLRPDEQDPMNTWLRGLQTSDPGERLASLRQAPQHTPEVILEMGRTALRADQGDLVSQAADALLAHDPWDWRAVWLLGLDALRRGDGAAAVDSFHAVYAQLPGEIAPRFALAAAHERVATDASLAAAESSYTTCLRTDAAYVVAAAFGIARTRATRGDFTGAVSAVSAVPPTSGAYSRARWMRADLQTRTDAGVPALMDVLADSRRITLEPHTRARLAVQVLEKALAARLAGDTREATLDGRSADEPTLRRSLESAYRDLARLTPAPGERHLLVDEANRIRPWSLI
ncbi:serine/threonine-protein kinase [Mobilicoccus pelagius]|uniref:non-specific serine/threonine protein kinase n=1 Tax=Mobilicoccus pelagius NBRC 104925 TaxID=1089455 RepID=H5UVV7_9MICO|nr:serine/threonine-protein kinase [Mobilicoccus pelagius]GAB49865.1 serine/threonine protein kinase PknG [Mobilicoccus pelagius NBRC 104925]